MKPNISNIVGRLYPENDRRKDAGLVIFYMSVNICINYHLLFCNTLLMLKTSMSDPQLQLLGMALGLAI